jgi:hypothetical protein
MKQIRTFTSWLVKEWGTYVLIGLFLFYTYPLVTGKITAEQLTSNMQQHVITVALLYAAIYNMRRTKTNQDAKGSENIK